MLISKLIYIFFGTTALHFPLFEQVILYFKAYLIKEFVRSEAKDVMLKDIINTHCIDSSKKVIPNPKFPNQDPGFVCFYANFSKPVENHETTTFLCFYFVLF